MRKTWIALWLAGATVLISWVSAQENKPDFTPQTEIEWLIISIVDWVKFSTFSRIPRFANNRVVRQCNSLGVELEALSPWKKRCHQCHEDATEKDGEHLARMDRMEEFFWENSAVDHTVFETESGGKLGVSLYMNWVQGMVCLLVDGRDDSNRFSFWDNTDFPSVQDFQAYFNSLK